MTGPSDSGGDIRRPPEELEGSPSLWENVLLSGFSGATPTEQRALEQSLYTGFKNPNVTKQERMRARDDAIRGLGYFGVNFDWDAWRREMGYSA